MCGSVFEVWKVFCYNYLGMTLTQRFDKQIHYLQKKKFHLMPETQVVENLGWEQTTMGQWATDYYNCNILLVIFKCNLDSLLSMGP